MLVLSLEKRHESLKPGVKGGRQAIHIPLMNATPFNLIHILHECTNKMTEVKKESSLGFLWQQLY